MTRLLVLPQHVAFKEDSKVVRGAAKISAVGQFGISANTLNSALLDRLLHHAEIVLIEGKSYRMKDQIEA